MPAQRLSLTATAVASSAGGATFTYPAPATDLVYHGTLVCTTAPVGAVFVASVAGTQWASWNGGAVGGPLQALPGEQVQVVATGLTASATYVLQWTGRSDALHETAPSYPDTNASPASTVSQSPGSSLNVLLQGGALLVSATNASATTVALLGTPPPGDNYSLHNATFELGSGATAVKIVGNATGFIYAESDNAADIFRPLMGQIVNESLNLVTVGGGGSVWLSYDLVAPPSGGGGGGGVAVLFQISHTYSVVGALTAQTLPPFFVPVMSGQTAVLESVRAVLQSGTSIAAAVQQNGVNIPGLGAVTVTPVAATVNPTNPVTLSNNDAIQVVLSSATGSPVGLSLSLYIQIT